MPRWEAVTSGRMSIDDALTTQPQQDTDPPSAELARALFSPYSAEEENALVDQLLARDDDGTRGEDAEGEDAEAEENQVRGTSAPLRIVDDSEDSDDGGTDSGRGTNRETQSSRAWLWGGLGVAAAAVLLGVWSIAPGDGSASSERSTMVARASSVPSYALELDGKVHATRSAKSGDDGDVERFASDRPLVAVLRPASAGAQDVGVRVCALSSTGALLPLGVLPERAASGSFRIAETPEAMGLGAGEWTLVFLVGDATAVAAVDLERVASEDFDGPWQTIRAQVEVLP